MNKSLMLIAKEDCCFPRNKKTATLKTLQFYILCMMIKM